MIPRIFDRHRMLNR